MPLMFRKHSWDIKETSTVIFTSLQVKGSKQPRIKMCINKTISISIFVLFCYVVKKVLVLFSLFSLNSIFQNIELPLTMWWLERDIRMLCREIWHQSQRSLLLSRAVQQSGAALQNTQISSLWWIRVFVQNFSIPNPPRKNIQFGLSTKLCPHIGYWGPPGIAPIPHYWLLYIGTVLHLPQSLAQSSECAPSPPHDREESLPPYSTSLRAQGHRQHGIQTPQSSPPSPSAPMCAHWSSLLGELWRERA